MFGDDFVQPPVAAAVAAFARKHGLELLFSDSAAAAALLQTQGGHHLEWGSWLVAKQCTETREKGVV